jgi:peptidyl-prolyl cis-trans isomerase B (cyclophilin B)
MPSKKRRKELARAKAQRQAQRRQEAAARARRSRIIGALTAGVIVAAAVVWAVWPDSSQPAAAPDQAETSAEPSASPTATAPAPVATPAGVSCEQPGEPRQDTRTWEAPADQGLQGQAAWVLDTNCGRITVALDTRSAPRNANALAFLTDQGFYTGNYCHRLTTAGIYVLQCGAPGADGTGDVGFSTPDENLPADGEANYPRGAVAMANRGADTASSQVFIVYKDTTLPPNYSVVGRVTDGLDVVRYVAAAGVQPGATDTTDGPPAQPIVIRKAQIGN